MKKEKSKQGRLFSKAKLRDSIFLKYFFTFAAIFLFVLIVLGILLTILVNNYTTRDRSSLLDENLDSITDTIKSTLIDQDMNSRYSLEKELLCETLATVSKSVDADIFVCDNEGNVILCKELAGTDPQNGYFRECSIHSSFMMKSDILSAVYQEGYVQQKITTSSGRELVVGRSVVSGGRIIGSVYAVSETGIQSLTQTVMWLFVISAAVSLALASVAIWLLTKRFVQPLRQMSRATKQFAVGDFSYRIKVKGNDELSQLGNAFNDMADSLDRLESSRAGFVSNVSHELKTPMTTISGFIDGILDGTVPQNRQSYYLGLVSAEVKRLSRLVVSMLNMSKMESGDINMNPSNFNLADIVVQIFLGFEKAINDKHLEIKGLDELSSVYIVADKDLIYQCVYNLVDNAVKFANDGGYISARVYQNGQNAVFKIKNSGTGIKSEELPKVFERFYKVDKSRSIDTKGAGLGLYLVRLIAEMHSGQAQAKSDSADTAEFTLTLPVNFSPVSITKPVKRQK